MLKTTKMILLVTLLLMSTGCQTHSNQVRKVNTDSTSNESTILSEEKSAVAISDDPREESVESSTEESEKVQEVVSSKSTTKTVKSDFGVDTNKYTKMPVGKNAKFLKENKTYRIDLDGNGKKERISYRVYKNTDTLEGYSPHVFINGKSRFTCHEHHSYGRAVDAFLYYIRLSNGKRYLLVEYLGDDEQPLEFRLMQYRNKKLRTVLNLNNLNVCKKNGSFILGRHFDTNKRIVKIKNNNINIFTCYTHNIVGMTWQIITLKYRNGKIHAPTSFTNLFYSSGSIYDLRDGVKPYHQDDAGGEELIVNKKIVAYKNAGSSKKAFTINRGDRISPLAFKLVRGKLYIRVQSNKKKGWVISDKKKLKIENAHMGA